MTEDEVVALILKKIIERTKRPEDQYREGALGRVPALVIHHR